MNQIPILQVRKKKSQDPKLGLKMTTIIVKREGTNGSEFRVSTIVAPPMPHINQKGRGQENEKKIVTLLTQWFQKLNVQVQDCRSKNKTNGRRLRSLKSQYFSSKTGLLV